jgi:hypothetical protein
MTTEASQLLAMALKKVDLRDGFSPVELGAKIGLTRPQAEAAARALANAGVLVLGFDFAAEFSADFRKSPAAVAAASSVPIAPVAKPATTTPAPAAARAKAASVAAASPPGKAVAAKSGKKPAAAGAASRARGATVKSRRGGGRGGRDHAVADARAATFKPGRDGALRRGRRTVTAAGRRALEVKSSRA